ncbi:hypothetical protein ACFQ07_28715 [Actinomadura adrarensis]|uniref:FXSXX-COOH protein n=1 Tax=Actinomadura adrarensis TaxID=1819600 RepID=A0ABW3CPG2_9ACTN
MTDHDLSAAEPPGTSREADVHIIRSHDLSDETPQTSGLKRFEAVSARRLGSQDRCPSSRPVRDGALRHQRSGSLVGR